MMDFIRDILELAEAKGWTFILGVESYSGKLTVEGLEPKKLAIIRQLIHGRLNAPYEIEVIAAPTLSE